ncbi:hypothetical protein ACIP79_30230 [Streptomyces sp. NPDC088747]|uniref:hypothetical protein n=1 Tax=Streptomyces sp. NPDC088747 TaxID=3365886 RepID=UPI00381C4AEB
MEKPKQEPGQEEEQESEGKVFDLTAVQVAASALATVVGAGLASMLGVTGTIIGAAVVSTSATTGAAVFQHAFRRTGEEIRSRVPSVGGARTPGEERAEQRADARAAFGAPAASEGSAESAASADSGSGPVTAVGGDSRWKSFAWKKYALATGLVFALGMVTVTAVELFAGKPVAAVLKNESGSGTSVGGGTAGDAEPADSPTPTPGASDGTVPGTADTVSPDASPTPDSSSGDAADPTVSPTPSAPESSVPSSSGDAVSSSDVAAD